MHSIKLQFTFSLYLLHVIINAINSPHFKWNNKLSSPFNYSSIQFASSHSSLVSFLLLLKSVKQMVCTPCWSHISRGGFLNLCQKFNSIRTETEFNLLRGRPWTHDTRPHHQDKYSTGSAHSELKIIWVNVWIINICFVLRCWRIFYNRLMSSKLKIVYICKIHEDSSYFIVLLILHT